MAGLSRRRFLGDGVNALMLAAIAGRVGRARPAPAAGTVNVLAWEGYADPEIVRPFEQRTGIEANVKAASPTAPLSR